MLELKFEEGEYRVYYDDVVRCSFILDVKNDPLIKRGKSPIVYALEISEVEAFGTDENGVLISTFDPEERQAVINQFKEMSGVNL